MPVSDDTINKIVKWAQDCEKKIPGIKKKMEENRLAVKKEEEEAWDKELGEAQRELYKEAYYTAIDIFYNNYDPEYYGRTFSLYRAWNPQFESTGLILGTVDDESGLPSIDYDEFLKKNVDGKLTNPVRKNDDFIYDDSLADLLFYQAFNEGWHGGAKKIDSEKADIWGPHPSPGTPYYRKPGWITTEDGEAIFHFWGKWGKRARKMRMPPKKWLDKEIKRLNKSELAKIDDELYEKHAKNLQEKVIAYESELFAPLFQADWLNDFK